MAMALYHPHLGYYTSDRNKIGRTGDYLTSPELTPLFGAMLGRQLREMWEALGAPPALDLVEVGAGTGILARDILAWAQRTAPDFFEAVRYAIVETSGSLAATQRARLEAEGLADRVRWSRELPPAATGVVFSNELLDAMPVHRVATHEDALTEVWVTWDGAAFTEELRPAKPEIAAYFGALGLRPGEGCRAEVNLAALDWIRGAAAALGSGFLLTLDYGYEAEDLYAPWRRDGTLLCFYRHNPSADPYARLGRQDITSHVDFTSIPRTGEEAGLRTLGLVSQSQFLTSLGITETLAPPSGDRPDMEEYFARRRAVMELLDPGGLGRVKVLIQARGVPEVALSSLTGIK
jgi:SAM-dependent MidA family methyltransferase